MTFDELEDLISQIYKEVDVRYEDRADYLVDSLSYPLYDSRPEKMLKILDELDAESLFKNSRFYDKLVKGIEDWIYESNKPYEEY